MVVCRQVINTSRNSALLANSLDNQNLDRTRHDGTLMPMHIWTTTLGWYVLMMVSWCVHEWRFRWTRLALTFLFESRHEDVGQ